MKHKVTLLRAFPDAYRQSMTLYADNLAGELSKANFLNIQSYAPRRVFLSPPLRYFSQYIDYALQALNLKADVYHLLDHSYAHLVHALPAKKTVITLHDMIGFENNKLTTRWNLTGLRKAARILCASEATRNHLLSLMDYPQNRIRTVHLGVDPIFPTASNKSEAKKKIGLSQDFHLLHVGHTGAYKNIPAIFNVLARLKQTCHVPVKLLKSGMPFTQEQIRLAESLGITNDIIHRGITNRNTMPDLYRAADLLLFPSLNEGFGFPVLEAFASGLPVVASNRGSLPEIAGEAAFLCDPNDYSALTSAVLSIIDEAPLRERLVAMGFKQVQHFTWEETARKTLAVYQEILSETQNLK